VADVRAYSAAHQMMHSWDFLTGTRRQLTAVWRAYHVYVAASRANIDHEPAIYLIDPQGRERTLYLPVTGGSRDARRVALGPGHPHVLVFLASWLSEVSDVPRQLQALERYSVRPYGRAGRPLWPLTRSPPSRPGTPWAGCSVRPGRSAIPSSRTPAGAAPTATGSRTCPGLS